MKSIGLIGLASLYRCGCAHPTTFRGLAVCFSSILRFPEHGAQVMGGLPPAIIAFRLELLPLRESTEC